MTASSRPDRRRRVERGIYQQPNGRYAVCVMVDSQSRFRTLSAATIGEARRQREMLQSIAHVGELPVSPQLTFAEVAARWLADFEAKVAAAERRDRTLDLYRSQLRRHLLPRFGRRRLTLITADDVVAVMRELQANDLSPWTIKRILGALSCVFTFALRRGYIATHPFHRLERDERPHPLRSDQRVLTQTELARLFTPARAGIGRCSPRARTRVCGSPRCSDAVTPRRLPSATGKRRRCALRSPWGRRCYLTKT